MSSPEHVVIVGGGLAGGKAAEALHDIGFRGRVTLVAAEPHLPYERPPLSKSLLAGESSFDEALVNPGEWYAEHGVDLRLGIRVGSIDRERHDVLLDDDSPLHYDKLVLATGSVPRHLPIPGADASGVHYLRTVEDAEAIRATFGQGKKLAVIGGGWIGLEVTAAARAAGTDVTVIEAAELPLLAVLGSELARVFVALHREHGVELRLDARIAEIVTADGGASGVRLEDGDTIEADAVVIGVGVAPDVTLAQQAGLDVDNGVLVDASLRTSDPDVYAVGDIANHEHPLLKQRVRVEHWANALNQPKAAIAALLGGDEQYEELPYFYTDQYDLGMEYIGFAPRGVESRVLVRGDLEKREFVAFWLDADSRMLAAMNVNVWDVIDQLKPIIASGRAVDADRLTDPAVPYGDL
ncbi:FAD-dependent oxidoreductase [Planctomonas sp. JC2975]|uniref:NAD(P)/FAD-dependent oxidoreductase n=1 Tax=Planctomonas sp. JC2975 TaxID=2729626 RepID=UPI0014731C4C|nr:FAD-dependent oxidoreductase [Planctomonas sp. JC2975]NNC11623.1 FAD-dependent oxidoreductase [Planctomonas sp. JC2975]